jgi:hypothetical protein
MRCLLDAKLTFFLRHAEQSSMGSASIDCDWTWFCSFEGFYFRLGWSAG